jgi:hypothetical protein
MLPQDDPQGMSREAVLLQWERKIEEAERRPSRLERSIEEAERRRSRFERSDEEEFRERSAASRERSAPFRERSAHTASITADATHAAPRRFERRAEPGNMALAGERRTITITARQAPPRRRRSVVEKQLAQPDRIALWAFLLGLFLVAVAAGTAHA